MKVKDLTKGAASATLVAAVTALALSTSIRVQSVAASNAQSGQLHVVKDSIKRLSACWSPLPQAAINSLMSPERYTAMRGDPTIKKQHRDRL